MIIYYKNSLNILATIDTTKLDQFYFKLLLDSDIELSQKLVTEIETTNLHRSVMLILDNFVDGQVKEEQISKFAEILTDISKFLAAMSEFSMFNNCRLWKFWRDLGDLYCKHATV